MSYFCFLVKLMPCTVRAAASGGEGLSDTTDGNVNTFDNHNNQTVKKMKVEANKMVGVDYTLTVDGKIADQSRPGQPLEFIFGTGMLLPKFEAAILGKEPGDRVEFTLAPKDGYGEFIAEAVVDLPKNIFMVDGKIADEMLYAGNQIPMSDAQGNRMMGIVKEVADDHVKMDFNHPMAGKTLNFAVEVISVRDVTPEDLQGHCSCGDCGGDCHHDHEGCDCGGDHEGCGCEGHCH